MKKRPKSAHSTKNISTLKFVFMRVALDRSENVAYVFGWIREAVKSWHSKIRTQLGTRREAVKFEKYLTASGTRWFAQKEPKLPYLVDTNTLCTKRERQWVVYIIALLSTMPEKIDKFGHTCVKLK